MPGFYPCIIIRSISIIIIVEFSGFMRYAFVKIVEQRQREEKRTRRLIDSSHLTLSSRARRPFEDETQ